MTALILLISPSPAAAQWVGKNEKKWGDSISSDIRNGAPADAICSNAKSSATTSDEVAFKNWAYAIARKYCSPDKLGQPMNVGQEGPEPECSLTIHQMQAIARGIHVMVHKGNCSMSFN